MVDGSTMTTTLKAAGRSEVTIHHFGAHVTSFKNAQGRELLYTSPLATFAGPKAIRGGIPICFPQFGQKGNIRQHGLARITPWKPAPFEGVGTVGVSSSSSSLAGPRRT